jgi:hypothetical protein
MRRALCMTTLIVFVLGGSLLALGACADDGALSPGVSDRLQAEVSEIRRLAEAGDAAQARAQLANLEASVAALRDQGEIDDERAQQILGAAAAVGQQLPTTTTTATPPPTPDPAPAPPDGAGTGRGEEDKGQGNDGKGNDGND